MKHFKLILLTGIILILIQQGSCSYGEAGNYVPPKTVLVDKELPFNNETLFPRSCEDLVCLMCCGGIPPSCNNDTDFNS
jgi:hypothetical protein